jgi:hypothetical protein
VIRPIVLRTPKRRHWLILDGGTYKRIAPAVLRTRLRELGLGWTLRGLKGDRRPSEIVALYGATVTPSIFAAAERGDNDCRVDASAD